MEREKVLKKGRKMPQLKKCEKKKNREKYRGMMEIKKMKKIIIFYLPFPCSMNKNQFPNYQEILHFSYLCV